jgi:hypothetical protein
LVAAHQLSLCLTQPKDSHECFVDAPLLLRGDPTDQLAEAARVDCADLLD